MHSLDHRLDHRLGHMLDQRATFPLFASILLTCGLLGCGANDEQQTLHTPTTTCSTNLQLEAFALDESYCAVADLALADPNSASLALAGSSLLSFQQAAAGLDGIAISFAVHERRISFEDGTLGEPEELLRFEMSIDGDEQLFSGEFLTRSTSGTLAIGYTRASDTGGAIMYGHAPNDSGELNAPGNYDAIWLDDDTLLVHSTGLGEEEQGAGVYVWQRDTVPRKLIDELGDHSSYLAAGPDVVYVGESAWPNNRVYAFTRAELQDAVVSRVALEKDAADMVYEGTARDVSAIGNDLAVLDISYDADFRATFNGVHRIGVSIDGASVRSTETTDLALPLEDAQTAPVQLVGSGELLGVVSATESGKNIAVVRLK